MDSEDLNKEETNIRECQPTPLNPNLKSHESSAIRSQKSNGNNVYNNSVSVNYLKRTIDFKPMLEVSAFRMKLLSYVAAMMCAITLTAIPTLIFTESHLVDKEVGYAIALFLLTSYLVLLPFIYLNKWFIKNMYPKFNYGNQRLIVFGATTKKRVVNPEAIIDNKYIIPCFSNIVIEYETTEDFSSNLERVEINNLFKNDSFKWYAVFYFTEKPVKGEMKLWWM
jgi:hypothetical protein